MAYSENISASLENSRNSLRRIACNDDTEFSHQSILNYMEKFVKAVNTMDETILVPCRLMDLKVGDENDPTCPIKQQQNLNKKKKGGNTVQDLLLSVDLFEIYNMLNNIKADLLWGQQEQLNVVDDGQTNQTQHPSNGRGQVIVKGHVRRPSTVSLASTNSSVSTISDSESDNGNENDSGIDDTQDFRENKAEQVAQNFRRHLVGLTRSLKQMTETAQYLTSRYSHDIGGGSV